jgi:hypothetical protein
MKFIAVGRLLLVEEDVEGGPVNEAFIAFGPVGAENPRGPLGAEKPLGPVGIA